jgi:2-polyprenyl-3-methyl-5-hydroxy-6-metoxy-1,4-benzoquinol methylase
MTVRVDAQGEEISAILQLADFQDLRVLEVGCGDGRLTWRYALRAGSVLAIDAFAPGIEKARAELANRMAPQIEFQQAGLIDFAARTKSAAFDAAILSWSL